MELHVTQLGSDWRAKQGEISGRNELRIEFCMQIFDIRLTVVFIRNGRSWRNGFSMAHNIEEKCVCIA